MGDAEWVLVEDVEVTCSWLMMPFVKGKMEEAHRGVCQKIIEKTEMQKRQQAIANFAPKANVRANTIGDDNINTGFTQMQREHYAKPHHDATPKAGAAEVDALDSQRLELSGSPAGRKV